MKLANKIRSFSLKAKMAVAILTLGAVIAVPLAVNAEFYPDRPVFDYNKSGNGDCNDPNNPARDGGRCGSLTGPVFNSFINTPSYGDERAFFDGRRSDMPTNTNADDIADVNKGSKEVVLRTYIHNNANQNTNNTNGMAHNTKVRIALPTATEQVLRARSYITADNAAMVEDTADLLGTEKFKVEYVPGSAKLLRGTSVYPLTDSVVSTGAQVGNTAMNGEFPGCFDYAALVEIRVKVIVQENPNLQLVKEVKVKGEQGWKKEVSTKPGTEVQFRLGTKNISNSTLTEVNVRDVMPPHVQLVPGSVRMIDANQDTVQKDTPLFGGGFGLGTYPSGGIRYIIFNTVTKDDFSECQVRVRNVAYAKSTQTPNEVKDSSDVVITKEKCNPPVTPSYSCDLLKATTGPNRTAKFTTSASASGGATIKSYIYNFGDGSAEFTTDKAIVDHTYAKDGNYAARVKVLVAVNNENKVAESDKCATVVSFTTPPTTTTPGTPGTPGTPTTLPSTGAGDVIAVFIAVTISSTVAYTVVVRRLSSI